MSDEEEAMAVKLANAAETGWPGDRPKQIQQLAAHGAVGPMALTGTILRALQILIEREAAEA